MTQQNDNEIIVAEVNEVVRPYINQLTRIERVAGCVNNIAGSLRECRQIAAEVELQRQQLDFHLNELLIRANYDLESRRQIIPLIASQLDHIQDRIDRFADKLMDMMDDFSNESIQKQTLLLDFIEKQNSSFQVLSLKLMK